ncbi:MAG: deoxyribonuclease IV [Dehalococcoidia bacterium]
MKIGAHVSTAGGLDNAIPNATEIGAETIQIFGSPPQRWGYRPHPEERIEAFNQRAEDAGISPVFLHGVYLINLGTENEANLAKATESLISHMRLASQIRAAGVIFHMGSHKGRGFDRVLPQVVSAMSSVLESTPEDTWLIIENAAGMGNHLGASFAEIGAVMGELGSGRVKVCLDTAHTLAAGYDIASEEGIEKAMSQFDREVGLENLVAVHANDSKIPLGGGVDRHENIGEGHIGKEGFRVIMGHPAFRDVPFILEVPGFEKTGPDKRNVDILRSIDQNRSGG